MATLQSLRVQLYFIRAYLFTCSEKIIEKLQQLMWPKEYLLEQIHQYSIADLYLIPKSTLANHLDQAVQFGRNHILSCSLCSQKGFICEICNSTNVIYPFDTDKNFRVNKLSLVNIGFQCSANICTFQCELCGAVYHSDCMNSTLSCPKCQRKSLRVDLPLCEAIHSSIDSNVPENTREMANSNIIYS